MKPKRLQWPKGQRYQKSQKNNTSMIWQGINKITDLFIEILIFLNENEKTHFAQNVKLNPAETYTIYEKMIHSHFRNYELWIAKSKNIYLLREVLIRNKKKSVNFHTFGPDPPPLKSVKCKKFIFFFTHYLKHILVKRTFFSLINP